MSWISKNKKILVILFSIIALLIVNEFTVLQLKELPTPLSNKSLYAIRAIDLLIVIFAFFAHRIPVLSIFRKIYFLTKFSSYIVFVLFLFIVFDLIFRFYGFGYATHYNEDNILRYPSPYDMFSGKPNVLDHNNQGFRGLDIGNSDIDKNTYRVAFFGGSTGYRGNPPIAEIISKSLSDLGVKNQMFNFSSISSNHNQHLHRLVKFLDNRLDLVIFYGGGNESLQNYYYDSRPGYPYNFFIRNGMSPLRLFLLRYSAFFGEFDQLTGLISNRRHLTNKNLNFEEWVDDISVNYINTHNISRTIVEKSIKPNVCSSAMYLPILQPLKLNSSKLNYIYDELYINSKNRIDGLIDLRYLTDRLTFTDYIHIDDKSKQVVSDQLLPVVRGLLEGCKKS